jgi:hypothetical protein
MGNNLLLLLWQQSDGFDAGIVPHNLPDESDRCWPDPTADIAQAFAVGPPAEKTTPQNVPDEATFWANADESVQAWAIQPPLNATQAQAFNTPDEGAYSPTIDDTAPALSLGIPAEKTTPQNVPDEGTYKPTLDDTAPAWAVQPPLNAVQAQAFNTPDEAAAAPSVDETSQSYAIQPPAAAAFDPASGFPWNQDEGERYVQSLIVDDTITYALGRPPLNVVLMQGTNVPDEGGYQTSTDETVQAWAIQPPAAAAFDPAGGFPWQVDDVIVRWPTATDDTSQPWSIYGPAELVPHNTPDEGTYAPTLDDTAPAWAVGPPAERTIVWNTADTGDYRPTTDDTVQPWAIVPPFAATDVPHNDYGPEPRWPAYVTDTDAAYAMAWAATFDSTVSIGGFPPGITAAFGAVGASAAGQVPGLSGATATPGASASGTTPGGSASTTKPSGS